MKTVIITVVRSKGRKGYSLRHNQSKGFKGIVDMEWGWYKYKSDAEAAAGELMKCWN
jgi:hypothetical protein